ncbi:putative enzyme related to aldose 1-epimerase [Handroanthus impetiginosus]|uniref:Putative enzyme related to aldose 1-epimerase n=1 Tax=Handroanthus impetiginosus TaxID=429701 RepID=A0A2G9FW75_9LAMI|nr:putative enzyme related to aldose 1-epimerase [Handroanthus impetiginosus]
MESSSSAGPKELTFVRGVNGYKVVLYGNHLCSVEVQLYGARVISWKNHHGQELLFVTKADSKPPKPVAGGIQICFPRVSAHGYRDLHELARYRRWKIDNSPPPLPTCSLTRAFVDLILKPSDDDLKLWPHRFEYRLRVALGHRGDLTLISLIKNMDITGGRNFSFTFAYRNYFRVSQINEVRVEGLGTLMYYIDNLEDEDHKILDHVDTITFQSEVDKVFLNTTSKICVMDQQKGQALVIHKEGLPDLGKQFE